MLIIIAMQNNKQDLDKVIVEISSLPSQSGRSLLRKIRPEALTVTF